MNCKGVGARLSSYLDGELSGFEMLAIRAHLTSCEHCAREADELRDLKWFVGSIPDQEPDEKFAERLKEQVFSSTAAHVTRQWSIAMFSGLAFAAALLVSLVALNSHHSFVAAPAPDKVVNASSNFDLQRDQAYYSGGDFFSDGSLVMTASSPTNASR